MRALGLPERIRACPFDLDGVITQTAKVHAAAWKEMFDTYLRTKARRSGEQFVAFDPVSDYDAYVDGKPRGQWHPFVPRIPRYRVARGRCR